MAGGRHLATYSGATTNFLHSDWLGTKRVMTSITGAQSQTCTGLPFGDGLNCTGTEWNFNHFTDDTHDGEDNLEHTWFRQYSNTQGRFTTADPALGSMDLGNPQSLNRYAYVLNNPVDLTDPLGLWCSGNVGEFTDTPCNPANAPELFNGSSFSSSLFDWFGALHPGPTLPGFDSFPPGFPGIGGGAPGSFGGIPLPGCILPGACNLQLPSLTQQINQWLAGPLNDPCVMSTISDLCGFANGFETLRGKSDEWNAGLKPAPDPNANIFDHYCGPGGGGPVEGKLDAACKAHDECYDRNGLKVADNWDPRIIFNSKKVSALMSCNQQLCDAATNSSDPRALAIITYFQTFSFGSCRAPAIHF